MTADTSTRSKDAEVVEAIPLEGTRAVVARQMTESLRQMAQLTLHRTAAVGRLLACRDQLPPDARPSLNDLLLVLVARVLPRHPALNATLENDTIYRWRPVHLGMAVALDDGLVVPVIRNAETLSLPAMSDETRRLAAAARAGTLRISDLQGATFTVTNLGGFGVETFTPIINPPQVAILGVGRALDDTIPFSLTIDHRALDGVPGARFLGDLADTLATAEF